MRRPVTTFFLLACGITWISLIPYALSRQGLLPHAFQLPALAAKFGPSIAGLLLTAWLWGERGLGDLGRRCFRGAVGLRWWLGCLLGPIFVVGAAHGIGTTLAGRTLDVDWSLGWVFLPRMLIHTFFGGGLGEELGWRGFALPVLQARYGALRASLTIGPVWVLWHSPELLAEPGREKLIEFLGFAVAVILGSIIMTWIYNGTRGSVLICIVFHAAVNAASKTVGRMTGVQESEVDPLGVWTLAALLVPFALYPLLRYGPRDLSAEPKQTLGVRS